jgi:hypothetical protein
MRDMHHSVNSCPLDSTCLSVTKYNFGFKHIILLNYALLYHVTNSCDAPFLSFTVQHTKGIQCTHTDPYGLLCRAAETSRIPCRNMCRP